MDDPKKIYEELLTRDSYWVKNPGQKGEVRERALGIIKMYGAKTVLDAGCGRCHLSNWLAGRGANVWACDIADSSSFAEKDVAFDQCSLTDLPYPGNALDLALAVDVLEHLEPQDVCQALRELARVSKRFYTRIACYPSGHEEFKSLHLVVKESRWWIKKLWRVGTILSGRVIRQPYGKAKKKIRVLYEAVVESGGEDA